MNEITEEISSFEPGVFEPSRRTLVRFEFEESSPLYFPFDFVGDNPVYPGITYDIAMGVSDSGTLTHLEITNLSEAGTLSFLVNGSAITFTSGNTGDSFPTSILAVPASGAWDLYCSQSISAGDDIQVDVISFDDPFIAFSNLSGFLES